MILLIIVINISIVSCMPYQYCLHHKTTIKDKGKKAYCTDVDLTKWEVIEDDKTFIGEFIVDARAFFYLGYGLLKSKL